VTFSPSPAHGTSPNSATRPWLLLAGNAHILTGGKAVALGDFGHGNTRRLEQLALKVQQPLQGFLHQVSRQNVSEICTRRLCVTSAAPAALKIVRLASA
jgi:hypothetical protein